tara:strand:- start:14 stop:337 length:324 start_codon:yes stop_codon:yes gene_type:complete
MKKITLTISILLLSIFSFCQTTTTTVKLKSGDEILYIKIKDYKTHSTLTVNDDVLNIDETEEIGNSYIIKCHERNGTMLFEFDFDSRKFRFYSSNKLIVYADIVEMY